MKHLYATITTLRSAKTASTSFLKLHKILIRKLIFHLYFLIFPSFHIITLLTVKMNGYGYMSSYASLSGILIPKYTRQHFLMPVHHLPDPYPVILF